MIKFRYTILYVPDVEQALSFYERVFDFERKFIAPDFSYGELLTGETTLSFASIELAKTTLVKGFIESNIKQDPFAIEIGFTTFEVEALVEKAVANGATLLAAPAKKPWGQVVAYVRDLNGFLVEICSPMS